MIALPRCLAPLTAAAVLSACAAAPTAPTLAPLSAPLTTSSGLVIGTLSYQYVDVERQAEPDWVVHFERIDAPATQDYALAVDVDRDTRSGVFTGALPAGVYAFRAAASANRRFAVGAMKMPFEVQAGAVQDAGHYTVDPIQ